MHFVVPFLPYERRFWLYRPEGDMSDKWTKRRCFRAAEIVEVTSDAAAGDEAVPITIIDYIGSDSAIYFKVEGRALSSDLALCRGPFPTIEEARRESRVIVNEVEAERVQKQKRLQAVEAEERRKAAEQERKDRLKNIAGLTIGAVGEIAATVWQAAMRSEGGPAFLGGASVRELNVRDLLGKKPSKQPASGSCVGELIDLLLADRKKKPRS